jgi:transposase InsO family protein
MCRVLKVSRAGYYAWLRRSPSARERSDRVLLSHIRRVHEAHRGHCGAVKTWRVLQLQGIAAGKHRVARIRQQHGIEARRRSRYVATTRSKAGGWHAPNLLQRRFTVTQPNCVWAGDVTHVPTREGWLYLAVLIDLYARKVVGWAMCNRNDTVLLTRCLAMALQRRRPGSGLIHHSDRGRTYAGRVYQGQLAAAGLRSSMSRRGDCWDNAVAESFFATLEFELIEGQVFTTRSIARSAIFEFIEVFYNRQRAHQTLGYRTPQDLEAQYVAI